MITNKYFLLMIWLFLISILFFILMKYQYKENRKKSNEIKVEKLYESIDELVTFDNIADKLVVFLHSECSCSETTLEELQKVLLKLKHKPKLYFIFSNPEGLKLDLKRSKLWQLAQSIDNSALYIDDKASLVNKHQILGSGTIVYFKNTKLLFVGGITSSRSHRGDNKGEASLVNLLRNKIDKLVYFPVFGCSLY